MYIAPPIQIAVAIATAMVIMQIPIAMNIQTLAVQQVRTDIVQTRIVTNTLIAVRQQIQVVDTQIPIATSIPTHVQRAALMEAQPTRIAMSTLIAVPRPHTVEVALMIVTIVITVTRSYFI